MFILSDFDLQLIGEGTHDRLYEKLGAHVLDVDGSSGTHFAVWAPNAREVSVVGDFNGWNPGANPLSRRGMAGVWSGFVPGIGAGTLYKYSIVAPDGGSRFDGPTPMPSPPKCRPGTASKVWDLTGFEWGDGDWMAAPRRPAVADGARSTIYEVHLGSWMRTPDEGNRPLTYREIAPRSWPTMPHEMGFTHVELMPVAEHPSPKSWGYQLVELLRPVGSATALPTT